MALNFGVLLPRSRSIYHSRIQLQDGGQGSSWRGSWWPILMKFEIQLLDGVSDPSRWPSPTNQSIKDPTPGWRTGVILTGFLMTNLDEIWNTASPWCSWLTKITNSNQSIHQGSNSRMEDGGHLDGVLDDLSWWNLKHSFSILFLTDQDDWLQLVCPSRI